MDNQFWQWVYNIIVSKEFISSIFGGLISGIISIVISIITVKSEVKHQKNIMNKEQNYKEKSNYCVVNDELEENKQILESYTSYFSANPQQEEIDTRKINMLKLQDNAWKNTRVVLLSLKDNELSKDISKFYKMVYGINNTTIVKKELPTDMLNKLKTLQEKIENVIRN